MEAIMVGVSALAILAAIFAFWYAGLLVSVGLLLLGFIAFGLSRIFDLLDDLFAAIGGPNKSTEAAAAEKGNP
jgi:hypothetical protein